MALKLAFRFNRTSYSPSTIRENNPIINKYRPASEESSGSSSSSNNSSSSCSINCSSNSSNSSVIFL